MTEKALVTHSRRRLKVAFALLGVMASPFVAEAAGPAALTRDLSDGKAYLQEGANALAPFAYVVFCMRNATQCAETPGLAVIAMDAEKSAQLQAINVAVNKAIRPASDPAGKDVWSVDVASGDCEDYALTKRKRLIAAGWPASALRIAVVRTAAGEGHAVLVVRSSEGDLVLDNRFSAIKHWNQTGLKWLKIQSGARPSQWFDLQKPQAPVAVSLKR